ncbi:MAG TPA: MBL fold metallo-hydrolase, partial [Vicinamibacterales bacterium]|nr:MBL fold metallo-hydrolase [Vicinamibacterales bacterium]
MKSLAGAVAVLAGSLSLVLVAQSPDVLENAARSMGAPGLQSIQYSGRGSVYLLGQAPAPGAPWPRFELAKYIASVDYARNAMREEQVRRDVERPPRGGGAGPFNPATGQGGIRPIPGDVSQNVVRDGRTEPGLIQIALTPHGFLKVAAANKASVTTSTARGRTNHAISFSIGRHVLTGTIDDRGLVERVETRIANAVLGDMLVEAVFADYRDYGGVKFPSRITHRQGGHAVLDLSVLDVQPNGAAAAPVNSPVPPAAATAAAPGGADAEKIGDGVWFLTGGNPMSVLVEFSDHVVVIEAPQGERRSDATIAAVKTLLPSKPIRYVVNTHHHFDHAGGIRGFVAAGIPVVTHQAN